MTAPGQQYGWVVRVTSPRRVWMCEQRTKAAAQELRDSVRADVRHCGDSAALFEFPLRADGTAASIRGRDVVSVELLGPRSDPRPAPDAGTVQRQYELSISVPPTVSGTDWLREMATHAPRGDR